MSERKADVKRWYDGFTFGSKTDIYNLWSVVSFLSKGKLLSGEHLIMPVDEQIVYNMLDADEAAICRITMILSKRSSRMT